MSDVERLLDAAYFAAEKHKGQRRKDKEASPYINHPLALARLLASEAGILDADVLVAALLHDTIEDTLTTESELEARFGRRVTDIVLEVTDDKSLEKHERKLQQVESAPHKSPGAAMVKLADKTCNLRDVADSPPFDWSLDRRREYFDWAKKVVDGLPDVDANLRRLFDEAHKARP